MHDTTNINMANQLAQEPTERYLARLIKGVGPMPIVAGPTMGTREGKPGPKVVGDDAELLEKTKHVRRPKECLMQFFARTGCGAHQVRTMTHEEISRFVETASRNEDVQPPASSFRPLPQKFVLEA